jgi:hypothetical protein
MIDEPKQKIEMEIIFREKNAAMIKTKVKNHVKEAGWKNAAVLAASPDKNMPPGRNEAGAALERNNRRVDSKRKKIAAVSIRAAFEVSTQYGHTSKLKLANAAGKTLLDT